MEPDKLEIVSIEVEEDNSEYIVARRSEGTARARAITIWTPHSPQKVLANETESWPALVLFYKIFLNTVARRSEGIARALATPSERRTQREWYFASRRSRGSP